MEQITTFEERQIAFDYAFAILNSEAEGIDVDDVIKEADKILKFLKG